MNQRIKELAENANAWYPMGYPSFEGGDEYWENVVIFDKEGFDQFAKSLIQECADYLTDVMDDHFAAEQLKEHFGVVRFNLTTREIELINGMIDVQLDHAKQCQSMIDRPGGNATMASKQLGWDMERVKLLRKIKEHFGVE